MANEERKIEIKGAFDDEGVLYGVYQDLTNVSPHEVAQLAVRVLSTMIMKAKGVELTSPEEVANVAFEVAQELMETDNG